MPKILVFSLLLTATCCSPKYRHKKRDNINDIYQNNKEKVIVIEDKYEDSTPKEISINCNSAIDSLKEGDQCTTTFYFFFHNGNLQETGCQGFYNGAGTPVGEWKEYDSTGQITKTTYYHNDVFGKDFIIVKYFENDKVVKQKKFNNYILYETEKQEMPL